MSRPACSDSSHLCSSTSQYAWTRSRPASTAAAQPGDGRLVHVVEPARRAFGPVEPALLEPFDPRPVLAQIVHEDPRLALEGPDPGQPLELAGVEAAGGHRDPEAKLAVPIAGLELDLVDREPEVVQAADAGSDRESVVGAELDLGVELVPQRHGTGCGRSRRPGSPRRSRPGDRCRRPGRPGRTPRSRRGSRGRTLAGRRTARGGPRSSRHRRDKPGSCRRHVGRACSRASSRPSRPRPGGGRPAARPSRRGAGHGRSSSPTGDASAGGGTGASGPGTS